MDYHLKRGPWALLVLLAVFSGVGLLFYFSAGDTLGGDAHSHLARTWLWQDIMAREAAFPIWTNRWYFGFPIDLYYGFLYYLVSGLVALLLAGNAILSTKITLWLLHIGSGLAMFACVRLLTNSQIAALFAGLFYVFSFQHTGSIVLAGALPLSLVFVLLPLGFYSVERSIRSQTSSGWMGTGAVFAALVFTHIQYGLYAVFTICVTAGLRAAIQMAEGKTDEARCQLRFILYASLFFLAIAAWYLVPLLAEKRELVMASSNTAIEFLGQFSSETLGRALNLVSWSREKRDWVFFYVGLVPLAVTVWGCLLKLRSKEAAFRSYGLACLLGGVWALSKDRYIGILLVLVCILSGYAVAEITERLNSKKSMAAAALVLLLFLDLGPTLQQRPYYFFDNRVFQELKKDLDERGVTGRIMVLARSREALWPSLDVIDTDISTPFGGIPQSSTRTYPFMASLASRVVAEVLDAGRIPSPISRDGLRLFDVRFLRERRTGSVYEVPFAYPAWFSQQLEKSGKDSRIIEAETWASIRSKFEQRTLDTTFLDAVLNRMKLSRENPVAEAIVLHNSFPDSELQFLQKGVPLKKDPRFDIEHAQETHFSFRMGYRSAAPGFVHLAYSFFPFNHVFLDGKKVSAYRSAMNFTVVPIPEGTHTLEIRAGVSPLRKALLGVSAISMVVVPLMAAVNRKKQNKYRKSVK